MTPSFGVVVVTDTQRTAEILRDKCTAKTNEDITQQDWPDGDPVRDEETTEKSFVTVTERTTFGRRLMTKTGVQLEETTSHGEPIIESHSEKPKSRLMICGESYQSHKREPVAKHPRIGERTYLVVSTFSTIPPCAARARDFFGIE